MDHETVAALSLPAPTKDAIARWIHDEQRIAFERAQLDAAKDAMLKLFEQRMAALDDQQRQLESFAPSVIRHFQEQETAGGGRTFASVEDGYVVKLRKQPTRLKYEESGGGDFFNWDNQHEKQFSRWKVRADMTAAEVEQFEAFFPDLVKFVKREPIASNVGVHFKATGEVPPEWKVTGGEDRLLVEPPEGLKAGKVSEALSEGGEA